MHPFKAIAIGALVFVRAVLAQSDQLAFTSSPTNVTAGQPVVITYTAPDLSIVSLLVLLS